MNNTKRRLRCFLKKLARCIKIINHRVNKIKETLKKSVSGNSILEFSGEQIKKLIKKKIIVVGNSGPGRKNKKEKKISFIIYIFIYIYIYILRKIVFICNA